jgi:biopolymer transport protein TolR
MAATMSSSTGSLRGQRRRRAMNEINMVPFIDVMLVLLIIFMVTAPLITTGVVDLPTVGKSATQPPKVVEVIVAADGKLRLRSDGATDSALTLAQLPQRVREAQGGKAEVPVIISADRNVAYDRVMVVMAALQKLGVTRIGLAVKQGS